MASPDRTSSALLRLAAALLPVLFGGGAPLAGMINPFWQTLFGLGVLILTYILPAPAGAHWNPFAIVLVPWLIAALLYGLSARLGRMPPLARRLSILAYASSFVMLVPAATLEARWPEVLQLPFYVALVAERPVHE